MMTTKPVIPKYKAGNPPSGPAIIQEMTCQCLDTDQMFDEVGLISYSTFVLPPTCLRLGVCGRYMHDGHCNNIINNLTITQGL